MNKPPPEACITAYHLATIAYHGARASKGGEKLHLDGARLDCSALRELLESKMCLTPGNPMLHSRLCEICDYVTNPNPNPTLKAL